VPFGGSSTTHDGGQHKGADDDTCEDPGSAAGRARRRCGDANWVMLTSLPK
jgi:hypothetical protein